MRSEVSNEQGLYNFAAVPPGTYTVKAELTGFKTFENKGIRVATQQFVTHGHQARCRPAAGNHHRDR